MSRGALHPVKAILLDALGTLLELQPPAPFLRAELFERYEVELSQAESERAIAAEIAFYRGHFDDGHDEQSLLRLRQRCAQELHDALPREAQGRLPPGPEMVEALLASLRFGVYPEIHSSLAGFRARGLRLVVVSNWDVSLHALLQRLGLDQALDGIITSAEVGQRKPSPAIFEQALRLAGVSAHEAIHVGDSLDDDVAGARAAGIEPVLVSRGGLPGPAAVRTIVSLEEVFG